MTARLPVPGSDNGAWGVILNDYLGVSLNADGTIQPSAVVAAGAVQIGGDIGGTASSPQITATHLSAALPVSQGGTGSTTKNFVDLSSSQTLTNKAVVQRTTTLTVSGSTYTPNSAIADLVRISSPTANFTVANDTGAPVDGQKMLMRILSSATAYSAAWGTGYKSSGVASLPTTLVASKTVTCGFIYDSNVSAWVLIALDAVGY